MFTLAVAALIFASIPALMFLRNLTLYRVPASPAQAAARSVLVLIPARNEAANMADVLYSVLASSNVQLEVVVGDDNSSDGTAAIVQQFAQRDARVRLLNVPGLPVGWNGKQHACWNLAKAASMPVLCFIDADVRLAPDALARALDYFQRSGAALISSVPRQITETWLERLLIPLIHFVLLGYLPMDGMQRSTSPAFSAGCGQLMLCQTEEYHAVGGHTAIRSSLHDGLTLTAAFRTAGYKTDLFDATPFAECRMYGDARQVWQGLAKNATEGMATVTRLPLFTVLLFGAAVFPWIVLAMAVLRHQGSGALMAFAAVVISLLPRLLAAHRFRQSTSFVLLHPVGVLLLLAIQWYALGRQWLGKPSSWKGRAYPAEPAMAAREGLAVAASKAKASQG